MQIIDGKPIYESYEEQQMVDAADTVRIYLSNDYCINGEYNTKQGSIMFIDDVINKLEEFKSKNIVSNSILIQMTFIDLDKVKGE